MTKKEKKPSRICSNDANRSRSNYSDASQMSLLFLLSLGQNSLFLSELGMAVVSVRSPSLHRQSPSPILLRLYLSLPLPSNLSASIPSRPASSHHSFQGAARGSRILYY
jgi:hypothetical protein